MEYMRRVESVFEIIAEPTPPRARKKLEGRAAVPSQLGNVLKLLSRARKQAVFSDFHHGLLVLLGHKMDCEFITSIRE